MKIDKHVNAVDSAAISDTNYKPAGKSAMQKRIYNALTAFFAVVLIVSGAYVGQWVYQLIRHRNMTEEISDIYESIVAYSYTAFAADGETPYEANPDTDLRIDTGDGLTERERLLIAEEFGRMRFAPLLEINEDFRGMIIIEGLGISEPYVHYSDNEKYLNTDFNGNRSSYGTIFMSAYNDRLLTDKNVVLFGHHMRAQAMFSPLTRYRDLNVVKNSNLVVLDSLTGKTQWLVFAAYTCEPDYGYINTKVTGDAFEELLEEIMARSLFHTNIEITADDQILTLSTCDYAFEDARFAVHARRVRPGEVIPSEIEVTANPSPKPYNVPMQQPLSEARVNSAAVMRHISNGRTYFYYIGESGIEWYTGNLWNVQGPYNCYSGDITSPGYLSAVMLEDRRVLMAVDRLNGGIGITLFISNLPQGRFSLVSQTPVTPEEQDARFPLLYTTGEDIWLLYTVVTEVPDESGEIIIIEQIFRVLIDLSGGFYHEPELLVTAENESIRAAGMVNNDERHLVIWHNTTNKTLYGRYIGADPETGSVQTPIPFIYSGDADKITFYGGITENTIRAISERNGRIYPDTIDISGIPIPEWLPMQQSPANIEEEEAPAEPDEDNNPDEQTETGAEAQTNNTDENNTEQELTDSIENDAPQSTATAVPAAPRVFVGAKAYTFYTYNINGYNYFNLRDIAYALRGTTAAFDISFENNAVVITTGIDYKPIGTEMQASSEGEQTAETSSFSILVNGTPSVLSAYNIDGRSYISIRELSAAIGLKVEQRGDALVIMLPPEPEPEEPDEPDPDESEELEEPNETDVNTEDEDDEPEENEQRVETTDDDEQSDGEQH